MFYDSDASGPECFFYMYQDTDLPEDRDLLVEQGLRYDVTVTPPITLGHYNPPILETEAQPNPRSMRFATVKPYVSLRG